MATEQEMLIQAEVQKNRVETLYDLVGTMSKELGACTMAMRDLTTQFAVYTEKHDNTDRTMQSLIASHEMMHKSINSHSVSIAEMRPTVESVRGLVWKVLTSLVLGMSGIGFLISALIK